MSTVRRLVVAALWLAIVTLIAVGGAGIVAAMHHVPGTASRPELTWAGDQAADPAIQAATDQLQAVSDSVEALGSTARQALAAVVAGDADQVNATVATGTLQLGTVKAEVATLDRLVAGVPGVGPGRALVVAPQIAARYDELAKTPVLTMDLEQSWAVFTGRALDATNLRALLDRHDQETAAAAKQGATGKYQTALELLDVSDATIAETRTVRDRLANTTDVSTLTTWVDRNAAYDAALRGLYDALQAANGTVTSAVRAAFDAEQRARANLPVDTRPLLVIMADVAQGGLNQAVIAIETTRGKLATAIDVQHGLEQVVALPE